MLTLRMFNSVDHRRNEQTANVPKQWPRSSTTERTFRKLSEMRAGYSTGNHFTSLKSLIFPSKIGRTKILSISACNPRKVLENLTYRNKIFQTVSTDNKDNTDHQPMMFAMHDFLPINWLEFIQNHMKRRFLIYDSTHPSLLYKLVYLLSHFWMGHQIRQGSLKLLLISISYLYDSEKKNLDTLLFSHKCVRMTGLRTSLKCMYFPIDISNNFD